MNSVSARRETSNDGSRFAPPTWSAGALLFVVFAVLFFIANRGAYESFFSDDDLDNLAWTVRLGAAKYLLGYLDPRLSSFNFRPSGHLYYIALEHLAGLHFGWYVAVLQALHLFNTALVWRLLRTWGASLTGAVAGTAVFGFHMACFYAYWRPMFIFDVVATTFLLISLLLYVRGHWLWALLPFWFAYKGKEIAVTLPAVLLLYEWITGSKQWKRIAPFAIIAASFTLQALFKNAGADNDYTFRFTFPALLQTVRFYSSEILLLPYAGLLLIPFAFLVKEPKARLGLWMIPLCIGPLWFLPGRLFAVYLYWPLVGLAVAVAFLLKQWKPAWLAGALVVWAAGNYAVLREHRRAELTIGHDNKAYVQAVEAYAHSHPQPQALLFDGGPRYMAVWGVRGIARWLYRNPEPPMASLHEPESAALKQIPGAVFWSWNQYKNRLMPSVYQPGVAPPSFLDMNRNCPPWLLLEGWDTLAAGYRWTSPTARVQLTQPAGATAFDIRLNVGSQQWAEQHGAEVELWIDGKSMGSRHYTVRDFSTQRWDVPSIPAARVVAVELRMPPFTPGGDKMRPLGVAVAQLGFVSSAKPMPAASPGPEN